MAVLLAGAAIWFTASKVVASSAEQLAGTVESTDARVLNFSITAPLSSVTVQPGQRVSAGQTLATVDTAVAEATVKADEAALEADKATLKQVQTLDPTVVAKLQAQVDAATAQTNGDQSQLDTMGSAYAAQEGTALARVKAAEAQVTLAKKLLAECEQCPCKNGSSVSNMADVPDALLATPTPDVTVSPTPTPGPTASATPSPQPTTGTPAKTGTTTKTTSKTTKTTSTVKHCDSQKQNLADAESALARAQDAYQRTLSQDAVAKARVGSSIAGDAARLGVAQADKNAGTAAADAAQLANLQAKIDSDVAALATSQADLSSRTLKAPFDGVVGQVGGTEGEVATPDGIRSFDGQSALTDKQGGLQILPQQPSVSTPQDQTYLPLVVLYSTQSRVAVQVPENRLSDVQVGDGGTVTLPAISGRHLQVKVLAVEPTPIRQNGKTYYVAHLEIDTGQNQSGLMPGMTADAVI